MMRLFALAIVLAFLVGGVAGYHFTSNHYIDKAEQLDLERAAAEGVRDAKTRQESHDMRAALEAANNTEPAIVERRVYVKPSAVRSAECNTVDDGSATAELEIDRATIRRLERLTANAERQYRECSHRLVAWQNSFKPLIKK